MWALVRSFPETKPQRIYVPSFEPKKESAGGYQKATKLSIPRAGEYPKKWFKKDYVGAAKEMFGDLVIEIPDDDLQEFPDPNGGKYQGAEYEVEAIREPWPAWYYPHNQLTLLYDPDVIDPRSDLSLYDEETLERARKGSVLQKFDDYTGETQAWDFYQKKIYGKNKPHYAGECDGWAIASLMEPPPTEALSVKSADGIRDLQFDIGDQKSLLLLLYHFIRVKKRFPVPNLKWTQADELFCLVGCRYDQTRIDTTNLQDIYPEFFHSFILYELMQNKRPFIMDHDPSHEVWNIPVYHAFIHYKIGRKKRMVTEIDVTTVRNGNTIRERVFPKVVEANPLTLSVEVGLRVGDYQIVDQEISREKLNTQKTARKLRTYRYDLVVEKSWKEGRRNFFKIAFGEWTGESIEDHPDFLVRIPKEIEVQSDNTELKEEWVNRLFTKKENQDEALP